MRIIFLACLITIDLKRRNNKQIYIYRTEILNTFTYNNRRKSFLIILYETQHEVFFFPPLPRRLGGALLLTRRSSSVSNQSSTAPINILTTYFKKFSLEKKSINQFTYITKTKWKIFSLYLMNFLSFRSIIISNIKIWDFFIPIIQITRKRNQK